ncbi:hypothetical protein F8M41_010439 [Gigaspora margarita]|uniref:Uncharacterized protein n=1 Tax=Gigaspora margarita TaxID=4874 RepID=A0A8H4A3A8_GIGMA|nr:hypothetical protein F8M41_010439 [Gigaspora margarita]
METCQKQKKQGIRNKEETTREKCELNGLENLAKMDGTSCEIDNQNSIKIETDKINRNENETCLNSSVSFEVVKNET